VKKKPLAAFLAVLFSFHVLGHCRHRAEDHGFEPHGAASAIARFQWPTVYHLEGKMIYTVDIGFTDTHSSFHRNAEAAERKYRRQPYR
jgi:hypothetical protein